MGGSGPPIPMPFINGTLVNDAGIVQNNLVAATYIPLASDVYINGTLHDNGGRMYTTVDPNQGATDVFINGIRHTDLGVRYLDVTGPFISWPEGFAVTVDGRQSAVTGPQVDYIRGITVTGGGGMSVSDLGGGPGVSNWQLEGSTDAWATESGGVWLTEAP